MQSMPTSKGGLPLTDDDDTPGLRNLSSVWCDGRAESGKSQAFDAARNGHGFAVRTCGSVRLPPLGDGNIVALSTMVARLVVLALLMAAASRSEEHTSELQSQSNLVCRLLLEKKKKKKKTYNYIEVRMIS